MKCARLCERSAEGGFRENLTGGHKNTRHTMQDRDVEIQNEDGELSQRVYWEIEGKEG